MSTTAPENAMHRLLQGLDVIPKMARVQEELSQKLTALLELFGRASAKPYDSDGWLDAKAAAEYLSISKGTFDAYRYQKDPKLPGHKLDGKTLYKKSDLDTWVKLYALKSAGFA